MSLSLNSGMTLDYSTLESLREYHPGWRLLCTPHAPLVASFLHRVFVIPNVRMISQSVLAELLEDELFALRQRLGEAVYPKPAIEYLNDWAANDKSWLRKFYRSDQDEPFFDLTPSTEKAIAWLVNLTDRSFVGTESRLLTIFDLLKQIVSGSEHDPKVRIDDLKKQTLELEKEIDRLESGDISLMDDSAIRDRFQQVASLSRELLSDFRQVEQNFRSLDRRTREKIASREGGKGDLLQKIMTSPPFSGQ